MYAGRKLQAVLCAGLFTAVGCSSARVVNQPLEKYSPTYGYTVKNPDMQRDLGKLQFYLMFSGGGTRASALTVFRSFEFH